MVAGCQSISVGEDQKIAGLLDRLGLSILVIVASRIRVEATDVMDDIGLRFISDAAMQGFHLWIKE